MGAEDFMSLLDEEVDENSALPGGLPATTEAPVESLDGADDFMRLMGGESQSSTSLPPPTATEVTQTAQPATVPTAPQGLGGETDSVTRTKINNSLTSRDISLDGAPQWARALSTLGIDRGTEAIERGLTTYFKDHLNEGETIKVEKDEETGVLLYVDPTTKNKTVIDPLGMDVGDWADILGDAMVVGPEILAGFVSVGQGGTTVAATESLASFAGESARLLLGRSTGANDLSNNEIVIEASKSAGIALGGAGVGLFLTNLFQGVSSVISGPGSIGIGPQTAGVIQRDLNEGANILDPILEKTGKTRDDVNFNAAQQSQNPLIARDQDVFAGGNADVTLKLRDQDVELNETLKEYYDLSAKEVLEDAGGDASSTGARLRDETVGRQEKSLAAVDNKIDQAKDQLEESFDPFIGHESMLTGSGEGIAGGDTMRKVFQQEVDRSKQNISLNHDRLITVAEREIGDLDVKMPITTNNFSSASSAMNVKSAKNILRNLDPEDKNISGKSLEALRKKSGDDIELFISPTDSVIIKQDANLSFMEATETLSFMKALLRKIDDGVETGVSQGEVKHLIGALTKDINESLAKFPDTALAYDGFNQLVFAEKSRLQRNFVSKIIKTGRNGGPDVLDSQVLKTVLDKPEGALRMAEILTQDRSIMDAAERALYDDGLEVMRNAVREKYRQKVLGATAAGEPKVNIKNHRQFLAENDSLLKTLYSAEDVNKFKSPEYMQTRTKELVEARRTLADRFKNTRLSRIIGNETNPTKIFESIWRNGSVSDQKLLKRQLARNPGLWREYKATVSEQIRNDINVGTKNNRDIFDWQKLRDIRGKNEDKLKELFGTEHVLNLKRLEIALRRANEPVKKAGSDASVSGLIDLARVVFRPLSREGKAFTSGLKFRRARFNRIMGEAMADPRKLKLLISLDRAISTSKDVAGVMGSLGAYSLIDIGQFEEQDPLPGFSDQVKGEMSRQRFFEKPVLGQPGL